METIVRKPSLWASWTWALPVLSAGLLVAAIFVGVGIALAVLCGIGLIGAVIAAVHHAEVVAHRVGEPFGTLVFAVSVTVIEASLILSMMLAGTDDPDLARDTIYAAIMIICNGVIGICVLAGGLSHHEQSFRVEGAGAGLAALIVMAVLTLVLPAFTATGASDAFDRWQLIFVAVSSATLWAIFVFIQTVRHRDYFLPAKNQADPDAHAAPPSQRESWLSLGLLLLSLIAVVGLAKMLSPSIEYAVDAFGAPKIVKGIVIAMLVLAPEAWAALRAARADRLQTSMNLAIGSSLACIGLTVPVVVVAAIWFELPLYLGLEPKDVALLSVTLLVSAVTLGTGRTHMMQGAIHLVLFAAFLFLALAG